MSNFFVKPFFYYYFFGIIRLHAKESCSNLEKEMERRETQLHEIEQSLPKPNGTYLTIILGSVNVSILNKHDK